MGICQVEISLYGATSSLHDQITRVPGSYARTIEALDLLAKIGIPTVIKVSMMRQNAQEIPKMKELALRLRAKLQISTLLIPRKDGSKDPLCHSACERDQQSYLLRLMEEKFT